MPLKTQTNTPAMEKRILKAARARLSRQATRHLFAFFEHGQWWIENHKTNAIWSVVDAEGGTAVDGFDFEKVTEGEE
jgi:hypothetical protein